MARRSQMKRIFEKRWWRQGCCVCNSTCCEDYGLNKDFFHGFLDEDKPIHFIYKGTKYKNNCAHQYSKCPQIQELQDSRIIGVAMSNVSHSFPCYLAISYSKHRILILHTQVSISIGSMNKYQLPLSAISHYLFLHF